MRLYFYYFTRSEEAKWVVKNNFLFSLPEVPLSSTSIKRIMNDLLNCAYLVYGWKKKEAWKKIAIHLNCWKRENYHLLFLFYFIIYYSISDWFFLCFNFHSAITKSITIIKISSRISLASIHIKAVRCAFYFYLFPSFFFIYIHFILTSLVAFFFLIPFLLLLLYKAFNWLFKTL